MPDRSPTDRPVILIPARFSESASALRYRAEVSARALVEAVFQAGGEPLVMHPHAPGGVANVDEVRSRLLRIADGVLLPGGGDFDSSWARQRPHPSEYDVDLDQDAFDLALARAALDSDLPILAVCRGTQAVNIVLGGNLTQDMAELSATATDHRHVVHPVSITPESTLSKITKASEKLTASCYHHQCIGTLAQGLVATAFAEDNVIEAVELPDRPAWFIGVQWHPEDTAANDPVQAEIFNAFIHAAAAR